MRNKIWLILAVCIISGNLHSQSGKITFNRKVNWLNIIKKLPYLSQEEKDRTMLVWGKDTNKGQDYILTYVDSMSIYLEKESDENFGYNWSDDPDIILRNHSAKSTKDIRFLLGKKYLIEDDMPRYKWKILNELKDVAGYVCMKAETRDTVNNIVVEAWFTDKIPFRGGPEGFSGLPGMILALDMNIDDVNIVATKVELSETPIVLPIPKKMKGKATTYQDYNEKKMKHIKLSVEGKRNPYWDVPY
ncbi:MAG TPA: GLPGLI family protein [Saprospiraceae bacterium]|nr:GLPGLI family protein [Saprospiraceae bacterium]